LQRGSEVVIRMLEDVKQVTIGPLIEVTVKRFVVPSSGLSDEPRCSQAELSV
jgi:hypothetical protein